MLVPINQAVNYIRDNYDIPKELFISFEIKNTTGSRKKNKQHNIKTYIIWLAKKNVVNTDVTEKKTVLYETDDLDAVFSNWNKTVKVSYEDVDEDLKLEAKKYIKWQLVNRLDIGVIKYKLTTDGLFRVYKNTELKVMNSKGKVVV